MTRRNSFITLTALIVTLLISDQGFGQNVFEDFGRAIEGELRRQIQPDRGNRGGPEPPQTRSQSVPGESGRSNPNSGGFGGSRFRQLAPNQQSGGRYQYENQYGGSESYQGSSTRTTTRSSSSSGQPITIKCPKGVSGSCPYVLRTSSQSYRFTIKGGQQQKFNETRPWRVSYTSGDGEKTYRLRGGNTYSFQKDRSGDWQLYRLAKVDDEEPPVLSE